MSKLNKKVNLKEKVVKNALVRQLDSHRNHMDGISYDIVDPFFRLRMVAASSFFGEPKYYKEKEIVRRCKTNRSIASNRMTAFFSDEIYELTPTAMMEKIIDEALDTGIEKTLQVAVDLRNSDFMRTTPQVILVRAAMHPEQKGTGLVRKYGKDICKRGDEPASELAYFINKYGRKTAIPNSLKRLWKEVLESFDDYVISKYRLEGNEVKTVDVVNLVHAYSPAIDKLVKGKSRQKKTWEHIVSSGDNSTKESSCKNWEKAISSMGHMALLRNLRNFEQKGVDFDLYAYKLLGGVKHGMQLPFRYYTAFDELKKAGASAQVLDLVEECLEKSFNSNIHFTGNVISLCDNSGSARGQSLSEGGRTTVAEVANLMGTMTAKMSDNGFVGTFGDKLNIRQIRKKSSIFDELDKVDLEGRNIGQATENGIWLFFDAAIKEKQIWDKIFVYSDMQAGHGGLYGFDSLKYPNVNGRYIDVPMLIEMYRKLVNPNVTVYLVQMAGYKDSLVPEYYDKTFILGGWSQNILKFADNIQNIYGN